METKLHPTPHPDAFSSEQFLFVPLKPSHVHLDYQAVMDTKHFLRLWSNSSWPSDHFTLQENLLDLERHHQEHIQEIAYTFTILNPIEDHCLGCIYINPVRWLKNLTQDEQQKLQSIDALCTYWVTEELMNQNLEKTILRKLIEWLTNDWHFFNLAFANNPNTPHQGKLFKQNGLQFYLSLSETNRYQNIWLTKGIQNGF